MNKNYLKAYEIVRKNEGGYLSEEKAKELNDVGGETFMGIARNFHGYWEGWKYIDKSNNPNELVHDEKVKKLVKQFFKERFWDKMMLDEISEKSLIIATEMFDTGVNMNWKRSAQFLQRTLNIFNRQETLWQDIVVDGYVGSNTIKVFNEAIKQGYEKEIAMCLNGLQINYYIEYAEKFPSQEIFMFGWIRHRAKNPLDVL